MMSCPCQQCGGECQQSGMGFLPAATAAAGAAAGGPVGAVVGAVVGAIASIFGAKSIFGFGADDQATDYRPPADSAERFIQFNDSMGAEEVSYDTSPQSLQIGINNGNRVEDIYSYYSAFVNNSVNAGASQAAGKVIMDVVNKYSVSVSRAADMVLKVVGLIRRVRALGSTSTQPRPTATQPTYTQAPRPIPQPAPYTQQYPVNSYTQQAQQYATQQPAQTTAGGSGDNSGALLLGAGALLFLVIARRRD